MNETGGTGRQRRVEPHINTTLLPWAKSNHGLGGKDSQEALTYGHGPAEGMLEAEASGTESGRPD